MNRQQHRGKHPMDDKSFTGNWVPKLQEAVEDLSWLLGRGYSFAASVKIVGDHFQLNKRQRNALARNADSPENIATRKKNEVLPGDLKGQNLVIDGFNQLIILESALSGGFVFHARDGCYRDLASVHSSYKRVAETLDAVNILLEALESLEVSKAEILLDSPVSNSGRLAGIIRLAVGEKKLPVEVKLFKDVDRQLKISDEVVVTADSNILNKCGKWTNLTGWIFRNRDIEVNLVEMSRFG